MGKKLIIAGGRDYVPAPWDRMALTGLIQAHQFDHIVTGGATGADDLGKKFALEEDLQHTEVPADWKAHGKAAGPIRNRQMAQMADAVVLFPGGRGTESMAQEAAKAGIQIFDWR